MILVVDDSEDNVEIIRAMLRPSGYDTKIVHNGEEALQAARTDHPDLILLDVMMPGLSGIQVLEKLRETPQTSRIPVILVTARTQDEDVISGYQVGADYYITRPFTQKQLLYGIKLVLGEKAAS